MNGSSASRQTQSQAQGRLGFRMQREKIAKFCRRWKIIELSLFGSVLRDDFRTDSDVDVLVTFASDADWGLNDLIEIKEELENLFKHPVDWVRNTLLKRAQTGSDENISSAARRRSMWRDPAWILDMLHAARKALEYSVGLGHVRKFYVVFWAKR